MPIRGNFSYIIDITFHKKHPIKKHSSQQRDIDYPRISRSSHEMQGRMREIIRQKNRPILDIVQVCFGEKGSTWNPYFSIIYGETAGNHSTKRSPLSLAPTGIFRSYFQKGLIAKASVSSRLISFLSSGEASS